MPANGNISVRIAPEFVDIQSPFSIGTQTLPPGGYVREHSHPEHDEALHFIRGTGKAVVDGVEYTIEPGVTIFVAGTAATCSSTTPMPSCIGCGSSSPTLEVFFEEVGRPVIPGEPDPTPFPRPDNVLEIERRTAFAPQPTDQRRPE